MAIRQKKKLTLESAGLVLFEVDGDFEALCAPVRAACPRIKLTGMDVGRGVSLLHPDSQ